jgi:hypothetical protein
MTRIEYRRLSDITYEQELELLAEVYRLALESYRKRKQEAADGSGGEDNGRKELDDSPARGIIPNDT